EGQGIYPTGCRVSRWLDLLYYPIIGCRRCYPAGDCDGIECSLVDHDLVRQCGGLGCSSRIHVGAKEGIFHMPRRAQGGSEEPTLAHRNLQRERNSALRGLRLSEFGHRRLHAHGGLDCQRRSVWPGEQPEQGITTKADELTIVISQDREHGAEAAVDQCSYLFGPLTPAAAQQLGQGCKTADVGKEQAALHEAPTGTPRRWVAHQIFKEVRR